MIDRAQLIPLPKPEEKPSPEPAAAPEKSSLVRLDLGCGRNKAEGFLGVDIATDCQADIVHDLRLYPWPFDDDSVDEVRCLIPGQRVTTLSGQRAIEMVVEGDYVLGASGFVRVLKTMKRQYSGRVLALRSAGGTPIVTVEHPIATPGGWLDADKLRHGLSLFQQPAKVEFAEAVDRGYVVGAVGRGATRRPLAPGEVVVGGSSSAKGEDQLHLLSLPDDIRLEHEKQPRHMDEAGINGYSPRLLPPRAAWLAPTVDAERHVHLGQERRRIVDDCSVAVVDHEVGLELGAPADGNGQRAFSVDQARQVASFGRSELHEVGEYHYVGEVYNLRTEDETFFVEGVLTHNCSHFFEHIPGLDRPRFMEEVWRILKEGCSATFITPYWSSVRAVQDFSHAFPPVVAESYHYFSAVGRKQLGVEHGWYDMKCNFDVDFPHQMVDAMWVARSPEALAWAAKHYSNVVHDITARLTKRPLVKGNGAA